MPGHGMQLFLDRLFFVGRCVLFRIRAVSLLSGLLRQLFLFLLLLGNFFLTLLERVVLFDHLQSSSIGLECGKRYRPIIPEKPTSDRVIAKTFDNYYLTINCLTLNILLSNRH